LVSGLLTCRCEAFDLLRAFEELADGFFAFGSEGGVAVGAGFVTGCSGAEVLAYEGTAGSESDPTRGRTAVPTDDQLMAFLTWEVGGMGNGSRSPAAVTLEQGRVRGLENGLPEGGVRVWVSGTPDARRPWAG
jgi:hypothetical protein